MPGSGSSPSSFKYPIQKVDSLRYSVILFGKGSLHSIGVFRPYTQIIAFYALVQGTRSKAEHPFHQDLVRLIVSAAHLKIVDVYAAVAVFTLAVFILELLDLLDLTVMSHTVMSAHLTMMLLLTLDDRTVKASLDHDLMRSHTGMIQLVMNLLI
jgi:hypothetical protein